MRAKAVAERAVLDSSLDVTVFAPGFVYAPGDHYLRLLRRMSLAPVMAIPGPADTLMQPICAEDVARCVMSVLQGATGADPSTGARYELAGPETLTHREIVELAMASFGRHRPIATIPPAIVRRAPGIAELLMGPTAFATWDEAQLLAVPAVSARGAADAQALGVAPRAMDSVLGLRPGWRRADLRFERV